MSKLILASGSKTRRSMLQNAGIDIEVHVAPVDESAIKESLIAENIPARDVADALADAKARAVAMMHPDRMILAADQILVQEGEFFTKAKNREQAEKTLSKMSGRSHQLISAAVIYDQGQPVWRAVDSATLHVRQLGPDFITWYLDTLGDDAFWSVGCYQLEGLGAQLFNKVEGNHFTILGLPLLPVIDFLRRTGKVPL